MLRALPLFLACAAAGACSDATPFGDAARGDTGAAPGDASDGAVDGTGPPPSMCPGGGHARISGTTFAPNGRDPIPGVLVYVTADDATFPPARTGVSCDRCATPPVARASVQSNPDGTFAFDGGALDAGGTFTVVFESGGFRHVERHVALPSCGAVALRADQTHLPGRSAGDDTVPRIVVAGYRSNPPRGADVNDRFTVVLDAIGVTEFDTVDPDRDGTNAGTGPDLLGLLGDATRLARYQVLVVPCGSLGNFDVAAHLTPAMVANLRAWLAMGGRLYSSDLAYSVVDQGAPGAITFAHGTPTRGDPADIGVGLATGASIPATIDDARLRSWLTQVGVLRAGATTIPVTELRDPWAAIDSVPDAELTSSMGAPPLGVVLASGDVSWHEGPTGPHHHPLTVQVDVSAAAGGACGRVVFTSYHVQTATTAASLSPQERVLEYLFFQLSACIETPG